MKSLIFLWENFGPMHVDRCEAVAKSGDQVIGLELYGKSDTYDWIPESSRTFKKHTLFTQGRPHGFKLLRCLMYFRFKQGKSVWFLSHYDWWEICLFAYFLRLLGDSVFMMGCSKYDDYDRSIFKESIKQIFFLPYKGVISSGIRSKKFYKFHGFDENKIFSEFNTLSLERIKQLSGTVPAPKGESYSSRYFTIVARLVPKKNLHVALDAYALYAKENENPRLLHICGNGPLEEELRKKADELGIQKNILFHGFVQTEIIAQKLGSTLALILPSKEEQFGNVVIEAQAMGLPVLLSDVCGARDNLVRTGVNGFVFESDNPEGLAWFMGLISNDQVLWQKMSEAASEYANKGDVVNFAKGVLLLTSKD